MFDSPQFAGHEQEIATAPGDLPIAAVLARREALRRQFRHDNTIEPLAPRPDTPVAVDATCGEECWLERAVLYYTVDGGVPDLSSPSIVMTQATVEWEPRAGYLAHWQAVIPPQPAAAIVRYRIGGWKNGGPPLATPRLWAHDGQGFWFRFPGQYGISTFAYRVELPDGPGPSASAHLPEWIRDAVVYQIFLDRFHPGSEDGSFPSNTQPRELHRGNLRGVRMAFPYLEELGVTCLWLSPISAAETYHRYDALDYYAIDPVLGTRSDLKGLVADAHGRGMRVIVDFVPSHLSWHHPAFDEARRDPNAPSVSWFTFYQWPDNYRSFLEAASSLPSLNVDDPGARAHIIGSAVHWMRDYGVDGFRLDHAIGPSMDFWVAFRAATQAANPDVFTVGEATDTPDSLRRFRQRLDSVLDFPLARALRLTFATSEWDVTRLDAFLQAYEDYMLSGPGRVSFLDNHDMDRFLAVAGGDVHRLKLAALCQFTLLPTPTVYYGTEIGMSQAALMSDAGSDGDAEARRDMIWDSSLWNHDLRVFYRELIRLRRSQSALTRGGSRTLHLHAEDGTYAYMRSETDADRGSSGVVIAFNLGDRERALQLSQLSGTTEILLATRDPSEMRQHGSSLILPPGTGAALATRYP
jgi:cyclomaltodextrinase / maltogenic alpha-amylase / neopullulanase